VLTAFQQGRGQIDCRDGIAALAQCKCIPACPSADIEDGSGGRQVLRQIALGEVVLESMLREPRVLRLHPLVVEGGDVADVVVHGALSFLSSASILARLVKKNKRPLLQVSKTHLFPAFSTSDFRPACLLRRANESSLRRCSRKRSWRTCPLLWALRLASTMIWSGFRSRVLSAWFAPDYNLPVSLPKRLPGITTIDVLDFKSRHLKEYLQLAWKECS
jgi:hypothetical protein